MGCSNMEWSNSLQNPTVLTEKMGVALRKLRFSSSILNMLKSSVGYENLRSNSPLHNEQTLKML